MGILRKFNEYFYSNDNSKEENPSEEVVPNEIDSEEEEAGDYHGTVGLTKLAKALGEEVHGNEIMHDGHRINFFSETEMYHVDGKKKFKTPEEVIEFLNNHVHGGNKEHTMESKRFKKK